MNCCFKFGFTAGFVLPASIGHSVSFNTTLRNLTCAKVVPAACARASSHFSCNWGANLLRRS